MTTKTRPRPDHKKVIERARTLTDAGHPSVYEAVGKEFDIHPVHVGRICRKAGFSVKETKLNNAGILRVALAILTAKPGKTLEDIGKSLKPPVSRQAVHQVRQSMIDAGFEENETYTFQPTN